MGSIFEDKIVAKNVVSSSNKAPSDSQIFSKPQPERVWDPIQRNYQTRSQTAEDRKVGVETKQDNVIS